MSIQLYRARRRARAFLATALTVSLSVALAVASAPASAASAVRAATPAALPAGWHTVSLAGVSLAAPASWPTFDFTAADSTGCVRYDTHAVYLGNPAQSNCPSRLVGHTETVQISVSATPAPAGAPLTITGGTEARPDLTVISGNSDLTVTITTGADDVLARQIAATVRFGASAAATKSPTGANSPTAPRSTETKVAKTKVAATSTGTIITTAYTGRGFDACSAPPVSTMKAWLASPYRAVGIYVGGGSRGCAQPNLTADWVARTLNMGWGLMPLYVGLQAPCTAYTKKVSTDIATARAQGTALANDAILSLNALGMGKGTPIYYDMEGYSSSDPTTLATCRAAVLAFLEAWTIQLHSQGYLSGVYSGVTAGIKDLASQWGTGYTEPDAVWMARWINLATESPSTASQPGINDAYWSSHQRIHQYAGGHYATYGGVQLWIDSNQVDAPVVAGNGTLWTAPSTCTGGAPTGGATTGGAIQATQWQGVAPAPTLAMPRVAGADRYATASLLAESYTAAQSGTATNAIVIANGEDFKGGFDALSASYLAGRVGAPILLTRGDALPDSTAATLCDVLNNGGTSTERNIYVIGSGDSVSNAVASQLANIYHPGGVTVTVSRIAGSDRYQTSAKIATVNFGSGVGSAPLTAGGASAPTAILASGVVNADALSAGPVSAALDLPVLLTAPDALDPSVAAALQSLGIRNVIALGGTDRISGSVVSQLQSMGLTVSRIAGSDRYDTAARLNGFARSVLGLAGSTVALANGVTGFPDALTAGPYLGRWGNALLLVPSDATALPDSSAAFLKAQAGTVTNVQALGQPATVSAAVLSQAAGLIG